MNTADTWPAFAADESPEAVLARWQEDEARVRQRLSPEAGVARRDQGGGRPGMALFEAIFNGEAPAVPIGQTLDFVAVEITPGRAVFQGRPAARFYNPMGTVHGGWYATLLDSALGCAVHSALPAGKGYTTLELKVNMIRALTVKVPLVRAEGRLVHLGGQTATAEARLYGADGRLYGHGSTTCLVFEMPAAAR